MNESKLLCLTLDLENDWYFGTPELDHLTLNYLDQFIELIKSINIPLSIFVVGKTLEKHPEAIDNIYETLDCEFHLHSYRHDTDKTYDFEDEIRQGKDVFRDHFGHDPIGYRAPQGNIEPNEFKILENHGFKFDSSVFPSYRPGIYNNLDMPKVPYVPKPSNDLVEVPIGTAFGRIPLAQSYAKLIGQPYLAYLKQSPLPNPLVYNIHLQDLYETRSHSRLSQPKRFIMRRNMANSLDIFIDIISLLRERGYQTVKMTDVLRSTSPIQSQ